MTAEPSSDGTEHDPLNRLYLALYIVYIVLGIGTRMLGWSHVDAVWFVDAARRVVDGSFDLYSFKAAPDIAPPLGITYSYSPLMAMVIAPFVGLADALGWGQAGAERILALPLLVADVLAMQQLRRLVTDLRPSVDQRLLFLGIVITLCLTSFWIVTALRGHVEGLLLLFLLLTIRYTPRNLLLGGVFAGLALAAKHTTGLLVLLPMGALLLLGTHSDGIGQDGSRGNEGGLKNIRNAAIWAAAAVGVFALFMLPAVLRNPEAVRYTFVTLPQRLVLLGPGVPVWLDRVALGALGPGEYAAFREGVIRYANPALLVGMALIVGAVVARWRSRGPVVGLHDPRLLGLMAFAGVAPIVLSKWVSGHYYQLPLALVLLWDIVRVTPARAAASDQKGTYFPWIGLLAPIAFRSLTPFDTPVLPWLKDAMLFTLFALVALLLLRSVLRGQPEAGQEGDAGSGTLGL